MGTPFLMGIPAIFSKVGYCKWLWPSAKCVFACVPPCWIPNLTEYLGKVTGWWIYLLHGVMREWKASFDRKDSASNFLRLSSLLLTSCL